MKQPCEHNIDFIGAKCLLRCMKQDVMFSFLLNSCTHGVETPIGST